MNRAQPLTTSKASERTRIAATFIVVVAVAASLLSPFADVSGARAAAGSRISGVAWSDTDRNGVRNGAEPVKAGLTVELLSSPGGAVIASTTTTAAGVYSFADVDDGDYVVRIDAPATGRFAVTAAGDNDFTRVGDPNPGDPERGVTSPFTISGSTQTVANAGYQPIADLTVTKMTWSDACDGYARTGMPPFDADDQPGNDSGTGNCVVRTSDSVYQNYSIALTGLPTGASVPNVVAEFTVSSPDGATLRLNGPAAGGMPDGCLYAANGAVPTSSSTTNPDGSITVTCNLGTMSSNVVAIQLVYEFTTATPVPSHAEISMRSYAAGGDAGNSNTVDGPLVEVTGTARWDLEKTNFGGWGDRPAGPYFTDLVIDGVTHEGYLVRYQINVRDKLEGTGGSELVWPVTFTDRLEGFPNARIIECQGSDQWDAGGASPWTLICPSRSEVQGSDGWEIGIRPNSGVGGDTGLGRMWMTVFLPLDEMNRKIDPGWQAGQPAPVGEFELSNAACDTDTWHINGGALNYGDGREPGYDCTGNNLATKTATARESQWDLQKSFSGGPWYSTQTIDGEQVDGYLVDYNLTVRDLAGADNVAPWLDRPVTFTDHWVDPEGAVLIQCFATNVGGGRATANPPTCETGPAADNEWDFTVTPTWYGFSQRSAHVTARFFIPMSEIPADPCATNVTLDLENEAINSDVWTVQGLPVNGTGFEPGWDGSEATGNNLVETHVRPAASQCGSLTGSKDFSAGWTYAGRKIDSGVGVGANNNRVTASNVQVCDVFDVSVLELLSTANPVAWIGASGAVNASDYVIEYAVGPNEVDTQAGAITGGLYPVDSSSNRDAVSKCRDDASIVWATDPATFGTGWRDQVNMVRVRPIDPALSETGPFGLSLGLHLQTRITYNGGPNDGEQIPGAIRVTNEGGWSSGGGGSAWGTEWSTTERQIPTVSPGLAISKSVTPNTYLPGDTVEWNLNTYASHVQVGMTMYNVRLVDTIPAGLEFNLQCTRDLLPQGVTVSYDAVTRQATFSAGDIPITAVNANDDRWMFHESSPDSERGALKICTDVSELAQPGTNYINRVQVMADNTAERPSAQATILVVGTGKLGIEKHVDKPYVASGEEYEWSLEWGNTSQMIPFMAPDIIDVLPWNGDFAAGSLSKRGQYATSFQGLAQLVGPLEPPQFLAGGAGDLAGTWYYATANPATIDHDSRVATNAGPEVPGGLWLTEAEVADFSSVTAIRFVSGGELPVKSRVRAAVPARSTSTALDNVYVNRATIVSPSFPNDLLFSNEPYVQMPGFTLGDLVWIDHDWNGRFDPAVDQPIAGVTVEVLDGNGEVVATTTTSADGRWSVAALPEGAYRARIPAAMFQTGGPLEAYQVKTFGAVDSNIENEATSNDNTAAPDPRSTGLTSSPVTLAYRYDGDNLAGGTGPSGDDVAHLAGELIADDFTNFTVDLFLTPMPRVDIEKHTNTIDADEPTGPFVAEGGDVEWTYIVTNTGSTELFDLTVTDDVTAVERIDCGEGSNVIPGPLAIGASTTCVARGTATTGQYANLGSVVARGPVAVDGEGEPLPLEEQDPPVTDEDWSHYYGSVPAVQLKKYTNGEDADQPSGPQILVGGAVVWTYVVTNTGNVPLVDLTVTDDRVDASRIDCGTGTNLMVGPLDVGASFTCTATGVATVGQYENLGTVVGYGPALTGTDGEPLGDPPMVTDDDPSHYVGVPPAIAGLAMTGSQLATTVWMIGLGLLLVGGALFRVARRRRDVRVD